MYDPLMFAPGILSVEHFLACTTSAPVFAIQSISMLLLDMPGAIATLILTSKVRTALAAGCDISLRCGIGIWEVDQGIGCIGVGGVAARMPMREHILVGVLE